MSPHGTHVRKRSLWRNPRVWIAGCSMTLVLVVAVVDLRSTSPGPLAAVHGREPSLTGWGSCAHCHGGWFGSMTGACLECHEAIETQIDGGTGLHGTLGESKAAQCGLCHSDHHGEEFSLVNAKAFLEAGVADAEQFDHATIGYPMAGRHLELACSECHTYAAEPVLPVGEKRYLGLSRDCQSCHEDSHDGAMALQCADCHLQTTFDRFHSDGHEEYLPLVGGHARANCRACHAKDSVFALEHVGRGANRTPRRCQNCHMAPHTDAFLAGQACDTCHEPQHGSFREPSLTISAEQHARTGYPLDPPHDEVRCDACHKREFEAFDERYPGREPENCRSCHEDPHGGQFGQRTCLECHDVLHFAPHDYTVEKHAETRLALTGSHVEAECNACHREIEGNPRQFHDTVATCEGCHVDAHDGYFRRYARTQPAQAHGQCELCHEPTQFRDVPEGRFDHGKATGFPIRGAHAQAACEACHERAAVPDLVGRTFGRVKEQFGRVKGCLPCHQDPHAGQFDAPDLPRTVAGETACLRCHVETSFRTIRASFDHGRWTGFPLDGAHENVGCAECHRPLPAPDEKTGRTWAKAPGVRCAECHEDPHAGQFRREGVVDCERCHRSTLAFKDIKFRHNLDSRFRLDETHAPLACGACHRPVRAGKFEIVRYRPLGMECADCHADQRSSLGGGARGKPR